ncbi:MAG: hypothetical protein ACOZAL_00600 [Patescibacteria group bacterium]
MADTKLVLKDLRQHLQEYLKRNAPTFGLPADKIFDYQAGHGLALVPPALEIYFPDPACQTERVTINNSKEYRHKIFCQIYYYGAKITLLGKYDEVQETLNKIHKFLIENPIITGFTQSIYPENGLIDVIDNSPSISGLGMLDPEHLIGGYIEFTVTVYQLY